MKTLEKDLYFIAVKVFLLKGRELFIFKDGFGNWDLPGGRVREDEFSKPLEKVLERKIKNELGPSVKYKLGKPVVFMRHERMEYLLNGRLEKRRIFAVGYEAKFLRGSIQLASHHTKFEWVPVKNFNAKKYFKGGWLKGVQEYLLQKR